MSKSGKHSASQPVARRRARKVAAATVGMVLAGGSAFAVSNWAVGFNASATGEGQSATITPLAITAVAAPSAGNLLYPGASGDVTITINNPNAFPVTVTALTVPAATVYAAGYSNSALTSAVGTCTSSTSLVGWNWGASSHTLSSPVTVAGNNGNLVVTLTNAASMGGLSPATCASSYFQMPAFTAVAASGGAATATTSPATVS
jgi:hypothetical protein